MKRTVNVILFLFSSSIIFSQAIRTGNEYPQIKKNLARGWNTWNTRSVLSHVLLPDRFALNLELTDPSSDKVLKEALIGKRGIEDEKIKPGPHTYDGSYTELTVNWAGQSVKITSAASGEDLVIYVVPADKKNSKTGNLHIRPQMIWGSEGTIAVDNNALIVTLPNKKVTVTSDGKGSEIKSDADGYYISVPIGKGVGISAGSIKSNSDIRSIIGKAGNKLAERKEALAENKDVYDAMQTVLAWDVIYDPENDRVIAPVSRLWNVNWGGYVLFCWDTYFASYMFSFDNKELSYANAIEITNSATDDGFVPNFAAPKNNKSFDRSQPPVGSLVIREIYKRYKEKWFLAEVFDKLLAWNRWWEKNRDKDGLLCWGSDPYKTGIQPKDANNLQAAEYESGLDNSPMYDGVPFDTITHLMQQSDVGLTSLYVMDCEALADIASELGKPEVRNEMLLKAQKYRANIHQLWEGSSTLYLNRRTDTKEFNHHISPTNFYALIAKVPTQKEAEEIIKAHLYNPREFWGDFVLPSIARNDPAFKDNNYWRGRIWAPMNFLVYIGLRNYKLPVIQNELVNMSKNLLLKEWNANGYVFENYNANTGEGADVVSSDKFYHWGALLGFMSLIESKKVDGPEKPLR